MIRRTPENQIRNRIWRPMAIAYTCAALGASTHAQVSNYTFAQSTVTYVQSTGANIAGLPAAWDDEVSTAQVPLTFNFVFNGVTYTSCWVASNGFITFGTTAPSTTEYNPISSADTYPGAISAFGRDLINFDATGPNRIKFQVQGTSPNRTAVFEWRTAVRYNAGAVTGDALNFQIRLNETSNTIDMRYGACAITNTTALTCEVGLRGASNADFNNRTTTTNWSATTAGGSNTAACTSRSTVIPTTNLNLRWTPPAPCTVTINPSPAGPFCGPANTVLTASGSTGTYSWSPSTGLSSTTVANPTCTATQTTTYTVTAIGCVGSATTTVTVNAQPGTVTVTPSTPAPICAGGSRNLTASGGTATLDPASGAGASTTVGNTTASTLGPNPFQIYYGGCKQQMMWRATELSALGLVAGSQINTLSINLATLRTDGTATLSNFRVKSQWSNTINALTTAPVSTGWLLQAGPASYTPVLGANTVTLGTPLVWNGTDNLLIEFNYSNNNTGTTGTTFNTATYDLSTSYVATTFYRVDNGTAAQLNNYAMTMNFTYQGRNNVGFGVSQPVNFTWNPNSSLTPSSGANVAASPASAQTYTVTANAPGGCTSSTSVTVGVNPLPTATASGGGTVCSDQALPDVTFTFTGAPPYNFTYSGPGGTSVTGHNSNTYTITNAAAGTYAVTAVSDANTCAGTNFGSSANVTVNPGATANAGGPYATCVDQPVPISATANGAGSWSGGAGSFANPNNLSTSYTPDLSEAGGTVTLTWTTNDPDGAGPCGIATSNATLTVNALPVVTCGTYGPVCVDAADITLGGSPAGGTWSGTGVTGNSFDPSVGTQTVQYDYTDGNGCSASCTTTITVNALPVVTCGTYGPVCVVAADITLGGSPAGGTWSGTGVTGNAFDPGVGTQTVQYDYTDGNGCSASCTTTITVNPLPVVTCPADITDICSVDAAFALAGNGENPTGGTFSGPGVSGGNFDPTVAGAGTHTITYSYTDGNGCSSSCTFTIDVTAATTWYGDLVDGDGLGDPAVTLDACAQPIGYVANSDDECPTVNGTIGSACDDGNCFTTGDVLNASCVCAGTLVPCDNWTLTIDAGSAGSEISWTITESGGPCVLATGGNYGNNTTNNVNVCVPQGNCFNLTFTDAGGNGIQGGGWKLTDNNGRRILDNVGNGGCFTTTSTTAEAFCNEPASAQTVIAIHCDKENWLPTDVIIASADAAVIAQYGIGDQTDDGYQFWFQNPCGGYNRKIFRNHATSGGQGPANALRATKLALSTIVTNPLPANTLLNVRVRARVNGVNAAWGPACRFKIDATACTITQLNNYNASPNYSCGASGKIVGASGNTGKIFANVVTSGGNPATHYRFQFSVAGEGYLRNVVSTNAACVLGVWATNPLLCGTYTYDVRVQASFDGGTTYCPFGPVCTVTITNSQPSPYCTTPSAMVEQTDVRSDNFDGGDFAMYPNPNRGDRLFVNMSGFDATVNIVTVEIYDGFGKRVMTATLPVQDGFLNTALELSPDMAAGLYMVNVTAGNITRTERLVIQR